MNTKTYTFLLLAFSFFSSDLQTQFLGALARKTEKAVEPKIEPKVEKKTEATKNSKP